MGRYSGKTCRLTVMLSLTASFFLVEIIVGYVTNSIALVADSFHMLSDVVALIVGFASVRISKWPSKRNTYGWVRAEILGALVNAVFLFALCFSILVEALKRLVQMEEVDNPVLLLVVGSIGLLINLIGLCLFRGGHGHSHGGSHGHSHGGSHGHSHGGSHGHSHDQSGKQGATYAQEAAEYKGLTNGQTVESESLVERDRVLVSSSVNQDDKEICTAPGTNVTIEMKKQSDPSQLNMRGVFLHVLGDALGSVVVIVSALVIWFAEGDWKYYADPAMSILMVCIILSTTIPLLKESAFILLQTVPSHVDVENIITELEQMEGIYGVHECHIWQLAGNRIVASAHIRCHGIEEYMDLAAKIKELFHKSGIHSTTIQPEFINYTEHTSDLTDCALRCENTSGVRCQPDTCCGDRINWLSKRLNSNTKGEHPNMEIDPQSQQMLNTNGNNHHPDSTAFTSARSLDMKFSPDGDEVVFEMTRLPMHTE